MRKLIFGLCLAVFLFCGTLLHATIFGKIQGIVHDPQHRPVAGASVKLQAITSDWSQTAQADDNGEFSFTTVPVGDYKITVSSAQVRDCGADRHSRFRLVADSSLSTGDRDA